MLKKIECFVPTTKLDDIKDALVQAGIEGMTVTDIRGFGRQQVYRKKRGELDRISFSPRVKFEIVIEEVLVDRIIAEIKRMAWTGNSGDGKIIVTPVEDAVRISTDEVGRSAIT